MGSWVNINIHFFFQAHLKVSAVWYCSHYLPPVLLTKVVNLLPVSLIPVANCHRCHWHRQQICRLYCWYQWQISWQCYCYRWCTFTCEYLCEFTKIFEMTLILFSWAWGKMVHEKNMKQKILWDCPFKAVYVFFSVSNFIFIANQWSTCLEWIRDGELELQGSPARGCCQPLLLRAGGSQVSLFSLGLEDLRWASSA